MRQCIFLLFIFNALSAGAQVTTAFTYPGELEQSGSAASGSFDFEFELFDSASGGVAFAGPAGTAGAMNMRGLRIDGPLRRAWAGAIVACLLASSIQGGPPPSGGDFVMRRATIDAGGGDAQGTGFALRGTIGQADTIVMNGAGLTLRGGFWTPSGTSDFLFRDSFE